MNKIHLIILAAAAMLPLSVRAQYAWQDGAEAGKLDLGKDVRYQVEMQGLSRMARRRCGSMPTSMASLRFRRPMVICEAVLVAPCLSTLHADGE